MIKQEYYCDLCGDIIAKSDDKNNRININHICYDLTVKPKDMVEKYPHYSRGLCGKIILCDNCSLKVADFFKLI